MKKLMFNVDGYLCNECSLALKRFIGGMDGVESIDLQQGKIAVRFDEREVDEEWLSKLTKDSIEKLGYRVEE